MTYSRLASLLSRTQTTMLITVPQIPGYHIIELIYAGSRTVVYRARQKSNSQPVIIKLLRQEYPTFNELVQFRNQYAIARNLDIAKIIKTYSLEPYKNGYALVMEDFGGISLAQCIHKQPLTADQFLPIAIQLAETLHQLHAARVIHKDIKPANILINTSTQQIKLIDFSMASLLPKETQEIQNSHLLEGTLPYISPEQTGRMNRGIDYRSDFYSLGITFYELLTGKLPFQSEKVMELVHCHIAQKPPSLQQLNPLIPPVLSDIVMKLMAKNAEDRYQSALGLQHDLEICLRQLQSTSHIANFAIALRDLSDRFIIPEKLYGRQTEVTALLDAFERVAEGSTELMLVAGLSGIGKTALVNEIHKPIVRQRGYFIKGKFEQFNRNIPFSAFLQAFRDLIKQLLSESDAQITQWKAKILNAIGENGQVIIEVIPELERLIGKQPAVAELSANAAQNRFNLLLQKFVQVFANKEHPLAIFLDDLQWADSASLKLLKLLMNDASHLLILAAYRDNEVSPVHPFMLTVNDLEKTGVTVSTIALQPLSQADINQLVADTLNCAGAAAGLQHCTLAQPLGELVYKKTKGNPFFISQFLKALHDDGLIKFNPNAGYWQCHISHIKAHSLTEDVVDFLAQQLQKLPQETQNVLKLAACIGAQFDLPTLGIICEKSEVETAQILWKALQEGFIVPLNETYKFFQEDVEIHQTAQSIAIPYRFLHDRVQQAAYSLIAEEQKQATHFRIGTLLLNDLSATQREERIFEIVNHLNIGKTLMTQPSQIEEIAQLNLCAGRKAKNSTAYAAAYNYIAAGMELLPLDCWKSHYKLSLAFYKERIEIEYLNGNFSIAKNWSDRALENVQTPLEKAEIYKIIIVQYTLQAKYPEAIQAGRQALALIDIDLPEENLDKARDAELAIAKEILKNRTFASLAELPIMTQPKKKMAIELLIAIGPPTYRSHQRLWSVICAKAVNLCLQYGNTPEIGYIYPAFGSLRGYAMNNYQDTGELLDVTLQLTQAFNNKSAESVAYLMIGSSLRHWSHPLKVATEDYLASYKIGVESSNLQYAAYAFGHNMYCRFYQSVHLEQLFQEITESLAFSQKHKNQWAIDLLIGGQTIVAEFMGKNADSPESIERSTEIAYLEQCREHKNWQVICIYNILKTQLLFFNERLIEALQYGKQAEAEIINVAPQGLLPYTHHLFIYSLLLTALYSQASEAEKLAYWEKISTYQKQLEIWAQNCQDNFLHLFCLVKAEVARISGNFIEAIERYDRAIALAKENGYIQEEALANELAAKFYLDWGKEKIAQVYMQEAYYCYARWGAKPKVINLEQRYPQLLAPILQPARNPSLNLLETLTTLQNTVSSSSSNSLSSLLDIGSLLQISQSFYSEIRLEKLVAQILQVVVENAGADKGALVINNEGSLEVAVKYIDGQVHNLESQALESCTHIPTSIIHYVERTLENVAVSTNIPAIFAADPYFLTNYPQSLLCAPILKQGKLIGILYLENNLAAKAFTSERIALLKFLSTQAAISLENAGLYQQAKLALTDLKQAQLQIVQSEKMSALGNLVAGVAHEINNPVGFLRGNIIPILDYIGDVFGLLDLYQKEWKNPTGAIQAKIEAIDLEYIRKDLPKLIASMQTGVDRIREISTSLRTFSRADSDRPVAFNLHDGLDSTLLILKHRLKANETRPEIKAIKNYTKMPMVECYAGQVNQVFMNILANAIDALEESNRNKSYQQIQTSPNCISISTEVEATGKYAIVRIADNGIGMSDEVKTKIFDHLFTTKGVGKGTGLGLAIARQIVVDKHGGTLSVSSMPGQGSEFIILLPIKQNA